MKLRTFLSLAFLALSSQALAQAPVCDVTCAPDPGGAGFNDIVSAMTMVPNMRGTQTVFSPETAGSHIIYHATGVGKTQAQSKIVAGSSSYSYAIPILSLPGRNGLDLNLTLFYNSAVWDANSDNGVMTFNADRDFPSYGFRLGFGYIVIGGGGYTLVDATGTKRQLTGSSDNFNTTDSSFINFKPSTGTLTYKNGTRVFYELFPNQTKLWRPNKIEDTNGNYISISYKTDSWAQGQEISNITDTLGRQITFSYDPTTHELTGISQGSQQYVSFTWNDSYTLQYKFSGWAVQNSPANNSTLKVLTAVTYTGNGAGYSFSYGGWGIINTITFGPTGGSVTRSSVSYNYPPGTTQLSYLPQFSQQTVFDGVNSYVWTYSTGSGSSAITDPSGTITTTNFNLQTGLLSSVVITNNGATLRTISNAWNSGTTNPTVAYTTTALENNQQSKVSFSYDSYNNVTDVNEYDYGLVYKRRTHTDYLADTNYTNAHIFDRAVTVKVYDESGSETLKKRTDFAYDESALTAYGSNPSQWDSGIGSFRGNVTTIKRYETPTEPSGEIDRHFAYDVAGNLISADLDCCTAKTWTFDSSNQFAYPTKITTGPLSVQTGYDFASGLMTSYTDENSQQSLYSYDAMFRLTNVQRPDLVNYSTSYDDTVALEKITSTSPVDNGITVTTISQLDGAGRTLRQTVQDTNSVTVSVVDTSFDGLGRRISVSNPYISGTPLYTQFQYDSLGRLKKVIPPDGSDSSNNLLYSYAGNTTTVTDPAGHRRKNYTDALGRLVQVDEPGGTPVPGPTSGQASVTFLAPGLINTYTFYPCGNQSCPVTEYDNGTITLTVAGQQFTIDYTGVASSDATAMASQINQNSSYVTATASGGTTYLTAKTTGSGTNYPISCCTYTWNTGAYNGIPFFSGPNDCATISDPASCTPTSGNLFGGTDWGGALSLSTPYSTFYGYDVMDNLTQVTQGSQQRIYSYGGLGHLLSATTPESGIVSYSYQTNGAACSSDPQKVCQRTDARNIVTTYQYDSINRLKAVSHSDSTPSVTYNYDQGGSGAYALSRLTSMTDGTGSETYTYDKLGRITNAAKVVGTATYNTGYGYNYIGEIKTLTYPDGVVLNQSYDSAGRLSQLSSGSTNYLTVPSGSYNAASLPTTLTYGSNVQATIGYNSRLQMSSLDYAKGTTDLLNLTYNYNQTYNGNTVNNGQIQGVTDTRGTAFSTSYNYDQLGRLLLGKTLDLTAANTWELGWLYDRYGNRTQQTLLGGTISTTTPQLTIEPTTNRITNAGYTYDNSGNLQADGTGANYTYDAENRLKTFANGSTSATYSYDGKGLRVKKTVGTNSTTYVFSGSKVIAEYGTNGTLSVKYVYAGSQLLATLYQSTATPVVYHYPDQLSARFETNPNGTITRTFGHLPFGETWYETGTPVKQKFTSYERDNESGLDYAVFRYDASRLGRFMTPDLLSGRMWAPQSLNRYIYTENDPIGLVDPLGLDDCTWDDTTNTLDCHIDPVLDLGPPPPPVPIPTTIDLLPEKTPAANNGTQKACPAVPAHPANANVNSNISLTNTVYWANWLNPPTQAAFTDAWLVSQVRPNGPWDYKTQGQQYDAFGNFNFGATGAAAGIPLQVLQTGAGAVSTLVGTNSSQYGSWWQPPLYGHAPNKSDMIAAGYAYYQNGCK